MVISMPLSSTANGFVDFGCTGTSPGGIRLLPKGVDMASEAGPVAASSRKFEENLASVRVVGGLSAMVSGQAQLSVAHSRDVLRGVVVCECAEEDGGL